VLNFRTINLISTLLYAGCILTLVNGYNYSVYILIVTIVIHVGLLSWGAFDVRSGVYIRSLWRKNTSEKVAVLTFDDGPNAMFTPTILDILDKHRISACFFCIGKNIETHPELTAEIVKRGHTIANHTYAHAAWFDLWPWKQMLRDIEACSTLIRKHGVEPRLFRPPYGVTNPMLARAVAASKLKTVGWSIRSLDTLAHNPQYLLSKVIKRLKPGSIILFHDNQPITANILDAFITQAKANGYRFVPIEEFV